MILSPQRRIEIPVRCFRCGRWRERTRLRNPQRFLPRWSRPSAIVNAAGIQVYSDGLAIKSGGLVVAEDGDSCCCDDPCFISTCGVNTPTTKTATFSGVSVCGGCATSGIHPPGNSASVTYAIDGVFDLRCLDQVAFIGCYPVGVSAVWRATANGSYGTYYDGDLTCSGTPYALSVLIIELVVETGGGPANWFCGAYLVDSFNPAVLARSHTRNVRIWGGSVTAPVFTTCNDTPTFTEGTTILDCGIGSAYYGGTCVIS